VPVTILSLSGELDASNYLDVIDAAKQACGSGVRDMVLDMGDCPHCQLHFVQAAHRHREWVQRDTLFAEIDPIVDERCGD
jgi:hypothetical protein